MLPFPKYADLPPNGLYKFQVKNECESRTFEDVLNILGIDFGYNSEDLIPNGYQFFTKSQSSRWMEGWLPIFNLEKGLKDYKNYLI